MAVLDSKKNIENVNRWRRRKGNQERKEKYRFLRKKGLNCYDANKMRFWSWERIEAYLQDIVFIKGVKVHTGGYKIHHRCFCEKCGGIKVYVGRCECVGYREKDCPKCCEEVCTSCEATGVKEVRAYHVYKGKILAFVERERF